MRDQIAFGIIIQRFRDQIDNWSESPSRAAARYIEAIVRKRPGPVPSWTQEVRGVDIQISVFAFSGAYRTAGTRLLSLMYGISWVRQKAGSRALPGYWCSNCGASHFGIGRSGTAVGAENTCEPHWAEQTQGRARIHVIVWTETVWTPKKQERHQRELREVGSSDPIRCLFWCPLSSRMGRFSGHQRRNRRDWDTGKCSGMS